MENSVCQLLDDLGDLLAELGEAQQANRARLIELRQRLVEGRFHLAVLGQFKRGKSTLLNALIGEALLPMALAGAKMPCARDVNVCFRSLGV